MFNLTFPEYCLATIHFICEIFKYAGNYILYFDFGNPI